MRVMRYIFCILLVFLFFLSASAQEKHISKIFSKAFEVMNEKSKKESFKGQILKGKRNGMGFLKEKDGSIYVGDFYRDVISGYGMLIAPENNYINNCDSCIVYIGNWQKGMKSGFGVCYANNGDIIYQGQFEKDKPIGKYPMANTNQQKYFSCINLGNGNIFLGEVNQGNANGYGTIVLQNGDLWLSSFKDGKRNGVGLYLLYNGEWETINVDDDNYDVISSSANYRNIDATRKEAFKNSLSEAMGYFTAAVQQTIELVGSIQSMKCGVTYAPNENVNNAEGISPSSANKSNKGTSISSPYSLSANQSKNIDSRTYANYDGMLSKMRTGIIEYNDSNRKEYQSKMRTLRQKWEQRGERFQHSKNEDWLGK